MLIKLYLIVNSPTDIYPIDGQTDPSLFDYSNVKFTFSPEALLSYQAEILKGPLTLQILALAENTTGVIKQILTFMPAASFVARTLIESVYKENNKILKSNALPEFKPKYEKPDNLFVTDTNWALATVAVDIKKYPLFIGPTGCGKTEFAYSLAAAMNKQFHPINCGAIFKPKATLVGTVQAREGSTYLVASEFLTAFTSEKPTLIFLDEISRIPSGAANYMMTILDRKQSYVYVEDEGRRAYKGENVVFCAAGNFGMAYTDTRNQDVAFLDRFSRLMVDYLSESEEVKMICQKVPGVNEKNVRELVRKANDCRKQVENLRVPVSSRQLLDMAEYLVAGISLDDVLNNLFVNLFINGSSDNREDVTKIINATS